ncbi:hypothetical protein V8C37DRAFT_416623 [Trichoderma ceciliae]
METEKEPTESTSIPDEAHEQARARKTHVSFGNDGVTATASAYGHLLQITRYIGNSPSGFFCVDLPKMPAPNFVTQRMACLEESSTNHQMGICLHLGSSHDEGKSKRKMPEVNFVHDRWPCFINEDPAKDLRVQYIVSNKTVYQTYTLTLKKEPTTLRIPELAVNSNLLLRDLDFINGNKENDHTLDSEHYSNHAPKGGCCVIRLHKAYQTGAETDAVALFISPFINGQPQNFDDNEGPNGYKITLDWETVGGLLKEKKIEITLAYTLKLISSKEVETISSPVSSEDLSKALQQMVQNPFNIQSFTGDAHLDFALRRNLEHILSVCSIPLPYFPDDGIPPIALTCGDISGHRVATAASFYSFQFLLRAFEYFKNESPQCSCELDNSTCGNYECHMRSRVWKVCLGHIKWLCGNMEMDEGLSEGPVCPNYWASGKIIAGWEDKWVLPRRSLTDTPLHIKEEPTPRFYFADHVMILWAIKSVEDLGLESKLCIPTNQSSNAANHQTITFSSNEMQTKRMIAVSRSSSSSRFLLRTEDTILFHAMELSLFDKPGMALDKANTWRNKIEAWKNVVDFQIQHKDNQDIHWVHPLQFGLATILSAHNKCMDLRSPEEIYDYSKLTLLGCSSTNGLFPGQLDEDKQPIFFTGEALRDSYWCTTFEVPYILWKYQRCLPVQEEPGLDLYQYRPFISRSSTIEPTLDTLQSTTSASLELNPILIEKLLKQHLISFASILESYTNKESLVNRRAVSSDNVVDQNNIVELSDEWLYNKPDFFKHHWDLSNDTTHAARTVRTFCVENRQALGSVMNRAMETILSKKTSKDTILGYIINVPKTKGGAEIDKRPICPITLNSSVYNYVYEKRTPESAKKRFFNFFRANAETALICYLVSSEREAISAFFDRHASYEKYFFEDITVGKNKWTTELHLSFYQMLSHNYQGNANHIPHMEEIELPHADEEDECKQISRAVMSLRFDGDFFDRYWTCHFFGFNPKWMTGETFEPLNVSDQSDQRRVLELLLFDKILHTMLMCVEEVLEEIRANVSRNLKRIRTGDLGRRKAAPGVNGASTLLEALDIFIEIDRDTFIYTIVEEDLAENLAKIERWLIREEERGYDKPRWTQKKERKYRDTISKLQIANIASFKLSLWEMRSMRSTDDVRLFTYVTVVFLPVSFATSVFSMSGPPSNQIVGSMAITAVVALLVTVIALVNAKSLDKYIMGPILRIFRHTLYTYILCPCIYFPVRYLFFPLYDSLCQLLPGINSPQSEDNKSFLKKLAGFGPINKARNDSYRERKDGNETQKKGSEMRRVETVMSMTTESFSRREGIVQRITRRFKKPDRREENSARDSVAEEGNSRNGHSYV